MALMDEEEADLSARLDRAEAHMAEIRDLVRQIRQEVERLAT